MAEIFDLKKERRDRQPPNESYLVRVDLYDDGIAGAVLDFGQTTEEMRIVADHLSTLSRWLRDQAAAEDSDANEDLLAEVRVFKSSRVWVSCRDEVETPEQLEWMDRRLDDAKSAARPKEKS